MMSSALSPSAPDALCYSLLHLLISSGLLVGASDLLGNCLPIPSSETCMVTQQTSTTAPESVPLHTLFLSKTVTPHTEGLPQLFLWPVCFSLSSQMWPSQCVPLHLWCPAQYLNVQTLHSLFHMLNFVQPYLIQTRWFMHLLSLEILIPAHTYRMRREVAIALKLACNRC